MTEPNEFDVIDPEVRSAVFSICERHGQDTRLGKRILAWLSALSTNNTTIDSSNENASFFEGLRSVLSTERSGHED